MYSTGPADISAAYLMIDQATIDRILDAAQIVEVVSDFVTLRKRGVNYVGLCPFHKEAAVLLYDGLLGKVDAV